METNSLTLGAFILAVIVGLAWALGQRIVEAVWPSKG
jgi:hypothetical protein